MISKVNDPKNPYPRICMAEPTDEQYKPFFKYSILHEWLDNEDTNDTPMIEYEKQVFEIFDQEHPECDMTTKQLFIKSRLAFFE
jgi:hypothetical protein